MTTDTTINFLLNHPVEHKLAPCRYYITRMHSLPLTPEWKQTEWTLIQLIAQNNNLPRKIILNLNQKIKHKKSSQDEKYGDKNKIWTTFTYYSPKIRKITNVILIYFDNLSCTCFNRRTNHHQVAVTVYAAYGIYRASTLTRCYHDQIGTVFHSYRTGNAVCCEVLHFLAEQRHRALYNQIGESNGVRIC